MFEFDLLLYKLSLQVASISYREKLTWFYKTVRKPEFERGKKNVKEKTLHRPSCRRKGKRKKWKKKEWHSDPLKNNWTKSISKREKKSKISFALAYEMDIVK